MSKLCFRLLVVSLLVYSTGAVLAQKRPIVKTPSRAEVGKVASLEEPDFTRFRVVTDQGILAVYDADEEWDGRDEPYSQLAYWHDFAGEQLFFFDRLLFTPDDVLQSVAAMERDLAIDPAPLIAEKRELSPLPEITSPGQWRPAIEADVLAVMSGGQAATEGTISGLVDRVICPPGGGAAAASGPVSAPIRGTSSLGLFALAQNSSGCPIGGGGGGGGTPDPPDPPCRTCSCDTACCDDPCACDPACCGDPCCGDPDCDPNNPPDCPGDSDCDGIPDWNDPDHPCIGECCGSTDPCCGVTDPCAALPCGNPCGPGCVECDDGLECTTDTCNNGDCSHTCAIGLAFLKGEVAGSECGDEFSIRILAIEFLNDFQLYRNAGAGDWDTGAAYKDFDWKKLGVNPNQPAAYARNRKMRFKVKLEVSGGSLYDGNAMLFVRGPDGLIGSISVPPACGKVTTTLSFYTTTTLPDAVKSYLPMSLAWSAIFPGSTTEIPIETTRHDIYVTYAASIKPTPKRLGAVCGWAAGENTVDGIAQKVYNWLSSNEPPRFQLNDPPICPNPWQLLREGSCAAGDCRKLAELMVEACGVLGVPASLGYTFATTDNNNFSIHSATRKAWKDWETKDLQNPNGQMQTYALWFNINDGININAGWNRYQAVCTVNNKYYAPKVVTDTNSVSLIKRLLCPNTPAANRYQCWVRDIGNHQAECHASQIPVPLPNGCP